MEKEYFCPLTEIQKNVIKNRILLDKKLEDKNQIYKLYQERIKTVAEFLAVKNDKEMKKKFYDVMIKGHFLPNSPCLVNAGKGQISQLSACFVLDVEDDIDDIYTKIWWTAKIHKSGGGTGFNFSKIRPEGANVNSTGGIASGVVSFMKIFDVSTGEIKQGAVRRGANIGILEVNHPEIIKFIKAKENKNQFKNFNLSVGMKNDFMEKVIKKEFESDYSLYHPKTGYKNIKIKEIWNLITQKAWETGDPGIIFIDKMREKNVVPPVEIIATNPCGEVPLGDMEACVLGSINLTSIVSKRNIFHIGENILNYDIKQLLNLIDWNYFQYLIEIGVTMLNQIIRKNKYPISRIESNMKKTRKIGLGIMGLADFFILLGIPYGSLKSFVILKCIADFLFVNAYKYSVIYAKKYNLKFRLYRDYTPENNEIHLYAREKLKLSKEDIPANANLVSIAPTGTLSILAGCSSGIEPLFALETIERRAETEVVVKNKLYQKFLDYGFSEKIIESLFLTTFDIEPEQHIEIQSIMQSYTDLSISKTINLPKNFPKERIHDIFVLAYKKGCKGITVYRDGSLEEQTILIKNDKIEVKKDKIKEEKNNNPEKFLKISKKVKELRDEKMELILNEILIDDISTKKDKEIENIITSLAIPENYKNKLTNEEIEFIKKNMSHPFFTNNLKPIERPPVLTAKVHRIKTGYGNLYITVSELCGKPFEVFCQIGKSGASEFAKAEAVGKLISLALRTGIHIQEIIKQIEGIMGAKATVTRDGYIKSIPDAIATVLKKYCENYEKNKNIKQKNINQENSDINNYSSFDSDICPECKNKLIKVTAGCKQCIACGYKTCGE